MGKARSQSSKKTTRKSSQKRDDEISSEVSVAALDLGDLSLDNGGDELTLDSEFARHGVRVASSVWNYPRRASTSRSGFSSGLRIERAYTR